MKIVAPMFAGLFGPASLHRLMFSLLYPAVLGTLFFSLLPALGRILPYAPDRPAEKVSAVKFLAGFLVVIHFVVDFQLADSIPVEAYGLCSFFLDLLIVIALFVAFDALNFGRATPVCVRWAGLAMAVTYGLFIPWAYCTLEKSPDLWLLWRTEAVGVVLFLTCAWKPRVVLLCMSLVIMLAAMAWWGSVPAGTMR